MVGVGLTSVLMAQFGSEALTTGSDDDSHIVNPTSFAKFSATQVAARITPTATPGPTSTDEPIVPDPIYTEDEAIRRALKLFPSGAQPVARLVTYETMNREWTIIHAEPQYGVWIVSMRNPEQLSQDEIASIFAPITTSESNSRPADSVYFAFDANSGYLRQFAPVVNVITRKSGTTYPETRTYEALISIPNDDVDVDPSFDAIR
jgi:hypothetical protein